MIENNLNFTSNFFVLRASLICFSIYDPVTGPSTDNVSFKNFASRSLYCIMTPNTNPLQIFSIIRCRSYACFPLDCNLAEGFFGHFAILNILLLIEVVIERGFDYIVIVCLKDVPFFVGSCQPLSARTNRR